MSYHHRCQPPECVSIQCRVQPKDIAYICSVLEGYDGLAIVSTLDQSEGLLQFCCTTDYRDDLLSFLCELGSEMPIYVAEEMRVDAQQLHAIETKYGRHKSRERNMPVSG
jgi:hypothetical protein